jgi:iron complex transport system substrate-binding protein
VRRLLLTLTALAVLAGCGSATAPISAQPSVTAQTTQSVALPITVRGTDGQEVTVTDTSRIVSLTGGITETVFALGLAENVVGRDVSSDFPGTQDITLVTQGHDVSAEGVLALAPTLVLGDARSGPPEALAAIRAAGVPVVLVPEVWSLEEMAARTQAIAEAVGLPEAANDVRVDTDGIQKVKGSPKVAFLYLRGNAAVYLLGGGQWRRLPARSGRCGRCRFRSRAGGVHTVDSGGPGRSPA